MPIIPGDKFGHQDPGDFPHGRYPWLLTRASDLGVGVQWEFNRIFHSDPWDLTIFNQELNNINI